jgi:ABC-type proline/glycine betaine transport system ATPase subunit
MKYGIQIRERDPNNVFQGVALFVPARTIDRLGSSGLECPHTTRKSAQEHADAINRKRNGKTACVVVL